MNTILLFVNFLVLIHTSFGFVDFAPGKDYIFKVEYQKSSKVQRKENHQIIEMQLTTMTAQMTVKKLPEDWLSYKFTKITKKHEGDDRDDVFFGLDQEFKAKVTKGKVEEFNDSVASSSKATHIKEKVIEVLAENHSDILHLPYTEVTDDKVTVNLPMGACKVTKLNLNTEEREHMKTITAKSNIHDCILSEKALSKMKNMTIDDFTEDSFNSIKLLFDTRTNQQIGVISDLEVAVNEDEFLAQVVGKVFINFIDAKDTSED